MRNYFDIPTILVIVVTFVLFVAALFAKGLTHDLLLEAGVFLVSVKLIMMGYSTNLTHQKLLRELEEIKGVLTKKG